MFLLDGENIFFLLPADSQCQDLRIVIIFCMNFYPILTMKLVKKGLIIWIFGIFHLTAMTWTKMLQVLDQTHNEELSLPILVNI